ncbi:hypothetical protein BC835DRAFT_291439 [Cytidiella melzeri]|nr:hypothetical protein BC835DRAFT_291439 [Cytidiella melzeri]
MIQSSSSTKLTKKQKKAQAFRDRRGGKGKGKAEEEDNNDVPVMEDQDCAQAEVEAGDVEGEARGGEEGEGVAKVVAERKKRRREESETGKGEENDKSKKKRKVEKVAGSAGVAEAGEGEADVVGSKPKEKSVKQQRFILFIGNLKYSTTKETIREHFAQTCVPPPQVRLMTPKVQAGRVATRSKGCAFLEFSSKPPLQEALKLHHSTIEGRQVNVELTAGGGGKSEGRLAKVKERNKELHGQRKKKLEKQKVSLDGDTELRDLERPQRYSATSGVDQAPITKRTWSIPNEKEAETKTRGKKKSKRPPKPLGTGVNAIPVG